MTPDWESVDREFKYRNFIFLGKISLNSLILNTKSKKKHDRMMAKRHKYGIAWNLHYKLWSITNKLVHPEILTLLEVESNKEVITSIREPDLGMLDKLSIKLCQNYKTNLIWGVLVLLKFYWAPDIVKFVLGRFSHFNIAIAYSNSKFLWRLNFTFLWVHLKFQQNEHTPDH